MQMMLKKKIKFVMLICVQMTQENVLTVFDPFNSVGALSTRV